MKCKFEHDGDCCNSGSPQYMCKCKLDACNSEVAMTNADRIRSMSDEELAQWLTYPVCAYTDCYKKCPASPENNREKCDENILEWLQQPAKEG